MARRGTAEGGDNGIVVRVGVVWVVRCWMVAVVLRRSFSDADVRFTDIPRTWGFKLASVIVFRGSTHSIVVIVGLIAACYWGVTWRLGKCHLPLVAHLGGLGVAQDFGAFQNAVGGKAGRRGTGDVFYLLAGGDVNGKFGAA